MRLNIGAKLIGGFLFVSLLVGVAGLLGIYNIGVVGKAGDVILNDKVPVADMSMESTIDIISARDALSEFLLSEEEQDLKVLEGEFHEFNTQFDRHLNAIVNGDSAIGVRAVDAGSEIARSVQNVQKIHEEFHSNALELMEHFRDHLKAEAEATELMEIFDNDAEQLERLLAGYEESITSEQGITLDKKIDASMEAKALMQKMKAIVEEYVALENASKKELRDEFMQTAQEFDLLKPYLPRDIVQKYEDFKTIAVGRGKMFDLKDNAIYNEGHTREHMAAIDDLGKKVNDAMAAVEENAGRDMQHAMENADRAEASSRSLLIMVTILALVTGVFIGIFITKGITGPIVQCVEFAKQVARGDLSRQVEITSKDETRDLGDALNGMFGYLKGMADV
ncbi:MAG: HAMP domain-containing protein, partial [bacterium]